MRESSRRAALSSICVHLHFQLWQYSQYSSFFSNRFPASIRSAAHVITGPRRVWQAVRAD
jgi:hypothetical protein